MAAASGVFRRLSDGEYGQALRVFYARTDSHRQVAEFVAQTVLPLLPDPPGGRRLLDVGAGNGRLAQRLLPLFPGGVLAVDINAPLLLGDDARSSTGAQASPAATAAGSLELRPGRVQRAVADFLQAALPLGQQFELVIAVHVLYQMPPAALAAFLRKMRGACAPGGRALVALAAPRGPLYAFERELDPGTVTSADVAAALDGLGLPYTCTPTRDEVNCLDTEAELRLVLRFLAQEAAGGALTGGAGAAPSPADEVAAAARIAAAMERHIAAWPRGAGGAWLLPEEWDLLLIG